jgi:two-component system phosphate regulon response regulator PhoB
MRPPRVLVVDDEEEMRRFYAGFFQRRHPGAFAAEIVPDAERALDALRLRPFDLAVLDWALPGISGPSLAKALRADPRTRAMGLLMVTALSSAQEVVAALEAGADDHLGKPFDERVLLARLRSLSRRGAREAGRETLSRFPGLELDWESGRLRLDGRPVHLKPRELDLLAVLLRRPGVLHPNAYLWEALWGYESDHWEHAIVATVSALRRKLGPRWGSRLRVLRGRGYSFEADAA